MSGLRQHPNISSGSAECRPGNRRKGAVAFTVIELMLAVAIMGVIIYALYSVFNQTQRALRRSETGVDVAQRARMIIEMVGREIEQAQPTRGFWPSMSGSELIYLTEVNMMGGLEYPPKVQAATDRADIEPRTNYLHNIYFYNNKTNAWQGIGYRVIYVTNGVGVLQRYETNQVGNRPISNRLAQAFVNEPLTNFTYHHVADGVIHLTFVPYDSTGRRLGWETTNREPENYTIMRSRMNGNIITDYSDTTTNHLATVLLSEAFPQSDLNLQYTTAFRFLSNALPAYIEMELGVLEPEVLEQYYLMLSDQNPNATNFLARQINKVHLFRQRIPIRAAAQ